MIAFLHGAVLEKTAGAVVVDVGGVGYLVHVAAGTFKRLPEPGEDVRVHVRTIVREDAIALFGFVEAQERDVFDMLLTVSGVGPKGALAVLGRDFAELVNAIAQGDAAAVAKAPGVGKKTAERVILELKDKIGYLASGAVATTTPTAYKDAISALVNLGYARVDVSRVLASVAKELGDDAALEAIIPAGLKILARFGAA